MTALLLSAAGAVTLVASVSHYATRILRGDTPRASIVGWGLLASIVLGIAGWVWASLEGGPRWAVVPLSSIPLASAPLLLYLHSQRKVPTSTIRVRVGDRLPPFEALTPEGVPFYSDALHGERILLKFFRGEWCPFCQAELKRFDAMEADLRRHGVRVVALSKDRPAAARRHRERDRLRLALLCDPDLRIIRRYGLEHRKALEASDGPRVKLFGVTAGTQPSFRHMAAPTTLLIDETGVIRWIDQTDDYKIRSSTERVLSAVHAVFGEGKPLARFAASAPLALANDGDAPCFDCG